MKKIILVLCLLFSNLATALEVADLRFYASASPTFYDKYMKWPLELEDNDLVAYILKSDPCLTISSSELGTRRFCRLFNGMTLEDTQNIQIHGITGSIGSADIYFTLKNKYYYCWVEVDGNYIRCSFTEDSKRKIYDCKITEQDQEMPCTTKIEVWNDADNYSTETLDGLR